MSDLDIRLKASFKDHRKRKKLAARVGRDGVLALVDLWLTAAETHPDGWLDGCTVEDIEIDAGWTGEAGKLAAALLDCGFLDQTKNGYTLHDWPEHQPFLATAPQRSAQAKANVDKRWERERARKAAASMQAAQEPNTPRIPPVYEQNTPAILPSLPSPSLPIPTPPNTGVVEPRQKSRPPEPDLATQTAAQTILKILKASGTWSMDGGIAAELAVGKLVLSRGEGPALEEAQWYADHHADPYVPAIRNVRDLEKWGGIRAAMDKVKAATPTADWYPDKPEEDKL